MDKVYQEKIADLNGRNRDLTRELALREQKTASLELTMRELTNKLPVTATPVPGVVGSNTTQLASSKKKILELEVKLCIIKSRTLVIIPLVPWY